MIHVCYGLHDADDRYSKFVATSIQSLLDNSNEKIQIHILHDETLSSDNRAKFQTISRNICFHNISGEPIKILRDSIDSKILERFSIGTFFRIFIPYVIDEPKAIYLDADCIVNLDIDELWQINLQNFSIAAENANLISDKLENSSEKFFSLRKRISRLSRLFCC